MPLTPKFFLNCQKSPFCSDHIGEKIIVVRFFLDFLWIFKIQKIRATAVHGRVTRRMGRVGLWRQPGKRFRLERWWESEETADQRPQRDGSEETFTSMPYRCVAANCRNVVDLSKCICTQLIPLAIKQPFHESTTGLVGTDSSNNFSGICLDGNCSLMIGSIG